MTKLFFWGACLHFNSVYAQLKTIDQKADSVLHSMTLEEKIGQLNQYNDDWTATGPVTLDNTKASNTAIYS